MKLSHTKRTLCNRVFVASMVMLPLTLLSACADDFGDLSEESAAEENTAETAFGLSGKDASLADILKYQNADGGWRKDYGTTSGEWGKSTIDNGTTYTEIRRVAKEYKSKKDAKYLKSFERGIGLLLKMQYANGGFPQIANSSGYHAHITYNDDAMVNVLALLDEVATKKGDFSFVDSALASKAAAAVTKGVDCILKTQVVSNGKLTAWGQQHDSKSLKPASARAYEVPSLCSSESVGVVKFLKTRKQDAKIKASIDAAVAWFKTTQLNGIKVVKENGDVVVKKDASASPLWARFSELGSNKPIFVGRDGKVKYSLAEIEKERRTGYSWYNSKPSALVK